MVQVGAHWGPGSLFPLTSGVQSFPLHVSPENSLGPLGKAPGEEGDIPSSLGRTKPARRVAQPPATILASHVHQLSGHCHPRRGSGRATTRSLGQPPRLGTKGLRWPSSPAQPHRAEAALLGTLGHTRPEGAGTPSTGVVAGSTSGNRSGDAAGPAQKALPRWGCRS